MSTAEDIEAAYGIDNHDLMPIPTPPSTAAADQCATAPTTASSSSADLASPKPPAGPATDANPNPNATPTSPSTASTSASPSASASATAPARPRIVRGRGNRLFGVLQSTLERANKDLANDQPTISARIQIQDRVRLQNQQTQAKLAALHTLRITRARLERDLADLNKRVVDVQMQMDTPGVHLRIESAPKHHGTGGGAQQHERKSGLEASLAAVKARVEKVKDELAEVARREHEVELEDKSPVSPTAKRVVHEKKDAEMADVALEPGQNVGVPQKNVEKDHEDCMDQD
ncbi:hypothetical protein BCR44DRAFT_1513856 [Catenaria anguillulae PL171]|uniref:Pinin/SDK/MemA protein domain-containing protein n=1 Tax=Catenaria anguillulae PL171 TaxID=765915 RepID=A0A1Y2HN27_9FUNG|nr:hypothetical protein BCR44DRAFT_1513856 [Catenaria anguillulae PL171]